MQVRPGQNWRERATGRLWRVVAWPVIGYPPYNNFVLTSKQDTITVDGIELNKQFRPTNP